MGFFYLQNMKIKYLALSRCIENTSFVQITFKKCKKIMIYVSKFVSLLWDHFKIDSRKMEIE